MEAKDRTLKSFGKFKEAVSEIVRNRTNNKCWWNNEKCPFYSEVKGFETAGPKCCDCSQLDQERLFNIIEYVFKDFLEEVKSEARKEEREELKEENEKRIEEAREEAYDEIAEGIDNLIKEIK